jgi:hypothetical protein
MQLNCVQVFGCYVTENTAHPISIRWTARLIPCREMIRIFCENCTKDTNTLRGQNTDLLVWSRWCVCLARSSKNVSEFHDVYMYSSTLTELGKRIKRFRTQKNPPEILLKHDSARPHRSLKTQEAITS